MNIKIFWFGRNLGLERVRAPRSHDLDDLFWRTDSLRSMIGGNKNHVVVCFLSDENLSFGHLADDSVF